MGAIAAKRSCYLGIGYKKLLQACRNIDAPNFIGSGTICDLAWSWRGLNKAKAFAAGTPGKSCGQSFVPFTLVCYMLDAERPGRRQVLRGQPTSQRE
jgi:hypothetical protein